jgi:hypothetical protein
MTFEHNQIGILVASISGALVAAVCVAIIAFKGNLPFTFSCCNPSSADRDIEENHERTSIRTSKSGEYETYSELYVAPDKQPTIAALDIMTRMLMVTGLLGRLRHKTHLAPHLPSQSLCQQGRPRQ